MQNTYNNIDEMVLDYENNISLVENLLQTQEEFNTFINVPSTVDELKSFLQVCEDNQLYEWCIDIKNKINEKV